MKTRSCIVAMVLTFAAPAAAAAEEPAALGSREADVATPGGMLVSVALGPSQAYGRVGHAQDSLSDWGVALQLELARRLGARWTAGAYGSLAAHRTMRLDGAAYSGSAGLQASYSLATGAGHSPWLSAGFGWHGHFVPGDGGRTALHGFDLLRLQVGIENARAPGLGVSPLLGASLVQFRWQKGGSAARYARVEDPGLAVFIFGGIRGEFDVFPG